MRWYFWFVWRLSLLWAHPHLHIELIIATTLNKQNIQKPTETFKSTTNAKEIRSISFQWHETLFNYCVNLYLFAMYNIRDFFKYIKKCAYTHIIRIWVEYTFGTCRLVLFCCIALRLPKPLLNKKIKKNTKKNVFNGLVMYLGTMARWMPAVFLLTKHVLIDLPFNYTFILYLKINCDAPAICSEKLCYIALDLKITPGNLNITLNNEPVQKNVVYFPYGFLYYIKPKRSNVIIECVRKRTEKNWRRISQTNHGLSHLDEGKANSDWHWIGVFFSYYLLLQFRMLKIGRMERSRAIDEMACSHFFPCS